MKGREVMIAQGREFSVYVDALTELTPGGSLQAAQPAVQTLMLTTARPDPKRLSDIRLKSGLIITGTVLGLQNGVYSIATEHGVMHIEQARVESITSKPSPLDTTTAVSSGTD